MTLEGGKIREPDFRRGKPQPEKMDESPTEREEDEVVKRQVDGVSCSQVMRWNPPT